MNRRDESVSTGFVQFPNYRHGTGEGGTFVRLVVVDHDELSEDSWMECCGGQSEFYKDECLVGSDVKYVGTEKFFAPCRHGKVSPYCLCVMTLGSTGWSDGEWICRYEDLTQEGKALYDLVRKLYDKPGCQLILQTYLDT